MSHNTKLYLYISKELIKASSPKMALILFLVFSLFLQGALGGIISCEDLPTELCTFSIASSGKRCSLETYLPRDGTVEYQCKTSEVIVETMPETIETDKCMSACGVERNSVGISSDSLHEPEFTSKLCAPPCYLGCPNIVDLYFNLALGEGVFLPDLCEKQQTNPHRVMTELLSSGAAPGPNSVAAMSPCSTESSALDAAAPASISI